MAEPPLVESKTSSGSMAPGDLDMRRVSLGIRAPARTPGHSGSPWVSTLGYSGRALTTCDSRQRVSLCAPRTVDGCTERTSIWTISSPDSDTIYRGVGTATRCRPVRHADCGDRRGSGWCVHGTRGRIVEIAVRCEVLVIHTEASSGSVVIALGGGRRKRWRRVPHVKGRANHGNHRTGRFISG